jgi:thiazole synthase
MGAAFRLAVEAGRRGFLAGLPAAATAADASSPLTGFLHS